MLEHDSENGVLQDRFSWPRWAGATGRLRRSELVAIIIGAGVLVMHSGFADVSAARVKEMTWVLLGAMSWLSLSRCVRLFLEFRQTNFMTAVGSVNPVFPAVWIIGLLWLWCDADKSSGSHSGAWTEIVLGIVVVFSILSGCRSLAAKTRNSAVLLVGSFLVVISLGTLLLKLPVCRAAPAGTVNESADWNVALFTATSASCVTGLIVVPTGSYWSPTGHAVIFGLFQVGGLGILTFGAFVAVLSGRRAMQYREARTLRDMLDAETVQGSRRLLLTILLFTVGVEAAGAVSLQGLWSDMPLRERIWPATFHSVSAFCNAGFSLRDEGFQGMGTQWQVWGPLTALIFLGGLGFAVVHDIWRFAAIGLHRRVTASLFHAESQRPRLSVHTRLVLYSAVLFLMIGTIGWFVFESLEAPADASGIGRFADAWFQSMTFRTAGFNTVDHQAMHPATKLMAIFLMFVGAAPGSTGGGVKTVVFAVTMLNILAVLRGRSRVEIFGRCIPTTQVARSLSMIAVGIFIVMATTGLLVVFERQPDRFLDHLYEATSAFGTVGVSAGITPDLSLPSRLLICVVMFLGRVGPITLLLAMTVPGETGRFNYPEERVSLG
ncbi:MAG: potassium transporter TrkG [Fuerstiella sp.]|nr:potassium transporter TrkG [Fuerstiella sp.]